MYALVTLASMLVVATISGLIIAVAPRLEQRDVRRAAYGDPDHTARSEPPGDGPTWTTGGRQRP